MRQSIQITDTVIRKDASLMGGEMGNETVMMDMNTGDYFGLNEVGSEIWKLIAQPIKVSAIRDHLMGIYTIDQTNCEAETLKHLEELATENMLDIV